MSWKLVCFFADSRRVAVVARDARDLDEKLAAARLALEAPPGRRPARGVFIGAGAAGPVACLFAGHASEHADSLRRLAQACPAVDAALRELEAAAATLGLEPPERCWRLISGGGAAGVVAAVALHRLFAGWGLQPAALAGHSNGETAALAAAGSAVVREGGSLGEWLLGYRAVELARAGVRGQVASAAVTAGDLPTVERAVERAGDVHVAMDNCPRQIIVSGRRRAVDALRDDLGDRCGRIVPLPLPDVYHTPLLGAHAGDIAQLYGHLDFTPGTVEVHSCATAAPFPSGGGAMRELAVDQWSRRVRFRETVEQLHARGVRIFLEIGLGMTLTGFVRDILRGRPHLAISTCRADGDARQCLLEAAAELYVAGVPMVIE